jgi:hypothetical protein
LEPNGILRPGKVGSFLELAPQSIRKNQSINNRKSVRPKERLQRRRNRERWNRNHRDRQGQLLGIPWHTGLPSLGSTF